MKEISDRNYSIYNRAFRKWGQKAQIEMATEELAELIVAIRHYERNKITKEDLITELADVYIMMEQIQMMSCVSAFDVEMEMDRKLDRLESRLSVGVEVPGVSK